METSPIIPTREISGYIHSPKTSTGFTRLRSRGVVLPPWMILDNVSKIVAALHGRLISDIEKKMLALSMSTGLPVSDSASWREMRDMESFFAAEGTIPEPPIQRGEPAWMKLREKIRASQEHREGVRYYFREFQRQLSGELPAQRYEKAIKQQMGNQLEQAQKHFFEDFVEDAPQRLGLEISYKLNRDDVFLQHLDRIHELYVDSAVKRIQGEQDDLKYAFLSQFTAWINGELPDQTGMNDIIEQMRETSVKQSKFFARDQFSKFNKALTIASYETADIEYVKWLTVGDGRVRPTHKALNVKVFRIDQIPDEQHDYNCRCALVPASKPKEEP